MRIKRKDLHRLIESLLFEGSKYPDGRPVWNYSQDSDWPASSLKKKNNKPGGQSLAIYDQLNSKRVLLLRDQDTYIEQGNTHGGESHAIKHLAEMDPQVVADYMQKAIGILRTAINKGDIDADIDTIDMDGNKEKIGIDDVTLGDMLNTVDQIYDESFNLGAADASPEADPAGMMNIQDKFSNQIMALLDEMNQTYDNRVDDIKQTAVDINDKYLESIGIETAQQLMDWFGKEHRTIMFMGKFRDSPQNEPMYLSTSDTAYVGNSDGKVNTLMLMRKKPPTNYDQIFGIYGNVKDEEGTITKESHTQIDTQEYSIFKEMCDGIKNKTLNTPSKLPKA